MSFCIPELFCREPSCQKYFTKSFLWKKDSNDHHISWLFFSLTLISWPPSLLVVSIIIESPIFECLSLLFNHVDSHSITRLLHSKEEVFFAVVSVELLVTFCCFRYAVVVVLLHYFLTAVVVQLQLSCPFANEDPKRNNRVRRALRRQSWDRMKEPEGSTPSSSYTSFILRSTFSETVSSSVFSFPF